MEIALHGMIVRLLPKAIEIHLRTTSIRCLLPKRSFICTMPLSSVEHPPHSKKAKADSPPSESIFAQRVVTVREWWGAIADDLKSENAKKFNLLDLRRDADYKERRLSHPGLNVVPLPMQQLRARSFELPARHVEFSILVDGCDLEESEKFLVGPRGPENKRPKKPWKVKHVLLAEEDLWKKAFSFGILVEGFDQMTEFPLSRLWQPDPMVESVLFPLLLEKMMSDGTQQIWDLASGSGRDVAFLAEELKSRNNTYHIWGLDHRYNDRETNITEAFWERRGLQSITKCIQMDLSAWGDVAAALPTNNLAALFCVRFWKAELIAGLVKSPKIRPGTLFGISHFCKPHGTLTWDFDHPSEKSVLERTQLRDLFQAHGWKILFDEIAMDSDHGRTMIHFVAQRL